MNRPKLDDKDYKAILRDIKKLEIRFGVAQSRGAMRRYLNHTKELGKRQRAITQLRSELAELESKSG